MSEVVTFYLNAVKPANPKLLWLFEKQAQASDFFKTHGFPNKRLEDWKYTSIDSFEKRRFSLLPTFSRPQVIPDRLLHLEAYICPVDAPHLISNALPEGAILCSLAAACERYPAYVKPYLGEILPMTHGFQALNFSAFQSGIFLWLPKGVRLQKPLLLLHPSETNHFQVMRHLVVAEGDNALEVVEYFQDAQESTTNVVTEIVLGPQSTLEHYRIQTAKEAAFHFGDVAVLQKEGSTFSSHFFSFGAALMRADLHVFLDEKEAKANLNGMYYLKGKTHLDHHTRVLHRVSQTHSSQDYRGVLTEHAKGVFNGKIRVESDVHGASATQQNKNLLLSRSAEMNTKPELSIFSEDIACSHGATVGHLDEEALFYMAARGIPYAEALQTLIQAFLMCQLALMPNRNVASIMETIFKEEHLS